MFGIIKTRFNIRADLTLALSVLSKMRDIIGFLLPTVPDKYIKSIFGTDGELQRDYD